MNVNVNGMCDGYGSIQSYSDQSQRGQAHRAARIGGVCVYPCIISTGIPFRVLHSSSLLKNIDRSDLYVQFVSSGQTTGNL